MTSHLSVKHRVDTNEQPHHTLPTIASIAADLKQRPKWDMRGKMGDMEKLVALNRDKLGELVRFQKDLQVKAEIKDSETKAALYREEELKAELQTLEKEHQLAMEEAQLKQKIYLQELVDEHRIYKRQNASYDLANSDLRRQVESKRKRRDIDAAENEHIMVDEKMSQIHIKLERTQQTIAEKEKKMQSLEAQRDYARQRLSMLTEQYKETKQHNARLLAMIAEYDPPDTLAHKNKEEAE
ncbi:hypothetical protein BDF14DRAFT_1743034 [Spinellus fusiger]|nr:hypothetical protein BDF14DRAFT_1743034 [Spinellus fusiger]